MTVIGYDTSAPITNPDEGKGFGLGDRFCDQDGKEFVFVQASGAIGGEGFVCIVDEAYQAVEASTTTSATAFGDMVGVAQHAFADNDYGWLQIKGPTLVQVSALCAANAAINTTATDGQLDDGGTAGSEIVSGLVLTTARGASAGTAPGFANYPTVGATN